jgi:hypothetical protein
MEIMRPDTAREALAGLLLSLGLLAIGIFAVKVGITPILAALGGASTAWFAYWLMEIRRREQIAAQPTSAAPESHSSR